LASFFGCNESAGGVNVFGMARANRLNLDGGIFHLTDRCHDQSFLLKFARDRDAYRSIVREHLRQFDISLLDYCITSNHVHLLADVPGQLELSGFMREVTSEFARAYNRRKHRMNAFWGDNYHATLVESGNYLWECLCYIELNMVRCGAVKHPREWEWVGYREIMGERKRYRLLDLERLCWRLGVDSLDDVRKNLSVSLTERIARNELKREPCWTQSLAVGSVDFLRKVQPQIRWRRETEIAAAIDGKAWVLHETPILTAEKQAPKTAVRP